ncbi:MAG: hypothetical protein N3D14_01865 [Aquificaceae bacterium]|nr:hypothetical protein [Aquificaceae bacterium]
MDKKVANNKAHHSPCFTELVENSTKEAKALGLKVVQIMAYKGYYTYKIFRHLTREIYKASNKRNWEGMKIKK